MFTRFDFRLGAASSQKISATHLCFESDTSSLRQQYCWESDSKDHSGWKRHNYFTTSLPYGLVHSVYYYYRHCHGPWLKIADCYDNAVACHCKDIVRACISNSKVCVLCVSCDTAEAFQVHSQFSTNSTGRQAMYLS